MATDEREWILEETGECPVVYMGPAIQRNSREVVVPKTRAVAAEQRATEWEEKAKYRARRFCQEVEAWRQAEQRVAELEREYEGLRIVAVEGLDERDRAEAERDALAEAIRTFLAIEYPDGEATEGFADAPAKALRAALAASVSKEEHEMAADLRPTVRVGQLWASTDWRDEKNGKRQHRLVVSVSQTSAELLTPGQKTTSRVLLRRRGDRSTIERHRLVEEASDGE